jgi:hypothetical protein
MTDERVLPSPDAPGEAERRAFLRQAALAAAAAVALGVPLEALAQDTQKKDTKKGSSLGGLVSGVTSDPKTTQLVVDVLKDALVSKDIKASIAKVAKGQAIPQKESGFLNSLSSSDLSGVANFQSGLKGLDAGSAVGIAKGLFGF